MFLDTAASLGCGNRVYQYYSCDYVSIPLNLKLIMIFIIIVRYHIILRLIQESSELLRYNSRDKGHLVVTVHQVFFQPIY